MTKKEEEDKGKGRNDDSNEFTQRRPTIHTLTTLNASAPFFVLNCGYESEDAIMSRLETTHAHPTLLITADTVAVYQGIIREKPSSKEEARQFIKCYSGGQATVVGSVVVTNLTTGTRKGASEKSEVYFHEIPDEVIDSLIDEGIILNVAGGLMLEHPLTLPFVDTVIGSADHVMGLPRGLTEKLIQEALALETPP